MRWLSRKVRAGWYRVTSLSQRLIIYVLCHALVLAGGVAVLAQFDSTAGEAIGTSLVATAAAGFALFAYVLISENWSQRIEGILDAGFLQTWSGRSVTIRDEYDSRLNDARVAIDVLGFGQQHFRDDQKGNFKKWVAGGVHVRILLLDPRAPSTNYSYAKQREKEEHVAPGSIAKDVAAFLQEVKRQGLAANPLFEVRLYTCLPLINVFRIDDELFWVLISSPT